MITSIILEWHNWSEHCAEDISWSRTTVYRRKNYITYEEFNGYNNVIRKHEGQYRQHSGECFFDMLEKINTILTQKQDYSVEACDGSSWKLKIRNSGNKLKKINGTVEYPPHGKRVERELIRLCNESGISDPKLFGCTGVSTAAAKAFANKWIKIFTEASPDANRKFGKLMGEDCFSVGFEMDCGKTFERIYQNERLLYSLNDFAAMIHQVTDIELLGSAIFSNWRRITHWSQENGMDDKNREWFLMALNRLKELVN